MAYLLKFMFQPLRLLWIIWRNTTGRGMLIRVYMKSGNTIDLDMIDVEWKTLNAQLQEITWKTSIPVRQLKHLNVEQIEAIVKIT